MVLAVSFLFLFFKANKDGQFEDSHTPAIRILFENKQSKPSKKDQPTKPKSYE
ncbi:cbb3-type cytochrome oxidase assembly protein [Algoriphagus namhaensis]